MAPHVRGLERRGLSATAVVLPRGRAESAVAAYRAGAPPDPGNVIGGHSFGGRVASLLASQERYGGLILLSYPLHPPGGRERWDQRTEHWPLISCPVLLLSGDRDPFATIDLLRQAVTRLSVAELIVYPRQGHGLANVLEDALDRTAAWVRDLPA
jgi:hypothetical protein